MNPKARPEMMDHRLERLIFFSDAVFAIAITLLIIEIDVPHLAYGTPSAVFLRRLGELWPHFFAFVLSFLVIGRFWVTHHRTMGLIHRYDTRLIWPNLLLLLGVAFMPYATALLGSNPGQMVPAILYNLMMMVVAGFQLLLQWAPDRAGLMDHKDEGGGPPLYVGSMSVVLGALCALLLSFVIPQLSQIAFATIPLWQKLLMRGRKVA